jgi:hypothetical protein
MRESLSRIINFLKNRSIKTMTTQSFFLIEYRRQILLDYGDDWAKDINKLNRFMTVCKETIEGKINRWNQDSDCAKRAYRIIGCKGKTTLKGLRALPKE